MRKMFCPDVQIRNQKTVAWIEANREPFNQRRRWEINSGTFENVEPQMTLETRVLTVVGTSVDALADLTYLRLHRKSKGDTSQDMDKTHVQASRFLVTISKQRMRSSARYMFR